MKKWFLLSTVVILLGTACKKDKGCTAITPTNVASAAETLFLQNFINANGITDAIEKNGMFYTLTQGSGVSPNACGTLAIKYKGRLISGTTLGGTFDETLNGNSASLQLDQLITGWKIVFPLVKAGATLKMYIPPSMGYGANAQPSRTGYSGIPANSYIMFEVELVSVTNTL
jgi:FKBP-type peptidyl-prolyl cis-trans isomerase FkpA